MSIDNPGETPQSTAVTRAELAEHTVHLGSALAALGLAFARTIDELHPDTRAWSKVREQVEFAQDELLKAGNRDAALLLLPLVRSLKPTR